MIAAGSGATTSAVVAASSTVSVCRIGAAQDAPAKIASVTTGRGWSSVAAGVGSDGIDSDAAVTPESRSRSSMRAARREIG